MELDSRFRGNDNLEEPGEGTRKGRFSTSFAVKQELFDRLLTAVLQVRNLFGAKFESTTESTDFYNYRYFELESPVVMFNLRINLNNYKEESRPSNNGGGGDSGDGGGESGD